MSFSKTSTPVVKIKPKSEWWHIYTMNYLHCLIQPVKLYKSLCYLRFVLNRSIWLGYNNWQLHCFHLTFKSHPIPTRLYISNISVSPERKINLIIILLYNLISQLSLDTLICMFFYASAVDFRCLWIVTSKWLDHVCLMPHTATNQLYSGGVLLLGGSFSSWRDKL